MLDPEMCVECEHHYSRCICCDEPCDPAESCDNCYEYWQRMRDEGYWDNNGWTEKGRQEYMK